MTISQGMSSKKSPSSYHVMVFRGVFPQKISGFSSTSSFKMGEAFPSFQLLPWGMYGQSPKHRSPEQPGAWSRVRVLLETQPSFLQTKCADELIELVLHMENIVARTTQLPLSQTSLDLPALNMSRAMLGGLVIISTFSNLFTKNMTRTL